MNLLVAIDTLVRRISQAAFAVGAVLLLALGTLGFADVISTNLFLRPIPGVVEISGTLLAVVVFLGLAEAQARNANIVIDIVVQMMSERGRHIARLLSLLIGTAMMATFAWRTAILASSAWQINETALGALPFSTLPGKILAFAGSVIATAEFGRQLLREIFPLDEGTPQS